MFEGVHACGVLRPEDKGAWLLASRMRDGSVVGGQLREAHNRAGQFLAYKVVAALGVEGYDMPHVQGRYDGVATMRVRVLAVSEF